MISWAGLIRASGGRAEEPGHPTSGQQVLAGMCPPALAAWRVDGAGQCCLSRPAPCAPVHTVTSVSTPQAPHPTASPQSGIWGESAVGTGDKPALTERPSEAGRAGPRSRACECRRRVSLCTSTRPSPAGQVAPTWGFPGGRVGLPAGSSCWLRTPHPTPTPGVCAGRSSRPAGDSDSDGDASCEPTRCPASRGLLRFPGPAGAAPPTSRAAPGGQGQEAVGAPHIKVAKVWRSRVRLRPCRQTHPVSGVLVPGWSPRTPAGLAGTGGCREATLSGPSGPVFQMSLWHLPAGKAAFGKSRQVTLFSVVKGGLSGLDLAAGRCRPGAGPAGLGPFPDPVSFTPACASGGGPGPAALSAVRPRLPGKLASEGRCSRLARQ